jgi:5-hydroxyisourate hydrolase
MGKLTTHILDTASGDPAKGVRVRLFSGGELVVETTTNSDGRCDSPLALDPAAGEYEIVFSMGEYFRERGVASPFLNEIPVRFLIEEGRNYHVPLACSPFSYSTYRGS